jgi:hypothetical protein
VNVVLSVVWERVEWLGAMWPLKNATMGTRCAATCNWNDH